MRRPAEARAARSCTSERGDSRASAEASTERSVPCRSCARGHLARAPGAHPRPWSARRAGNCLLTGGVAGGQVRPRRCPSRRVRQHRAVGAVTRPLGLPRRAARRGVAVARATRRREPLTTPAASVTNQPTTTSDWSRATATTTRAASHRRDALSPPLAERRTAQPPSLLSSFYWGHSRRHSSRAASPVGVRRSLAELHSEESAARRPPLRRALAASLPLLPLTCAPPRALPRPSSSPLAVIFSLSGVVAVSHLAASRLASRLARPRPSRA